MKNANQIFETERLILRPSSETDAEFVFELFNTPKWLQFIGDRNITTIESAKNYIQTKLLPQHERLGFGNYTIIRKLDNTKIGSCGLYDREGLDGIDIGFAFLPQFEKMGYAFEAANHLKKMALENFGLKKLSAITTKDNFASQKLLEKLGLKFCETISLPNDPEELMLFEIELKSQTN